VPIPEETPSTLLTHLALAVNRYVRQLRKDGLPVPPVIDELAGFLTVYVRNHQAPIGMEGDYGVPQEIPAVQRLMITKAEAAEQLGVSVRTIERLVSAGRLPLVHVEGAARLRVADIEAYVEALSPLDAVQIDPGKKV